MTSEKSHYLSNRIREIFDGDLAQNIEDIMNGFSEEIAGAVSPISNIQKPFIICALETLAKTLRAQSSRAAEVADELNDVLQRDFDTSIVEISRECKR